ncbi:FAD-binding oxidoreductase [Thermoplasmatales archaeon ex4484_30]|nr:MAG: FAD-binding oxidoreductase [Thermoplasmatales archaeon ex4484_30]
MLSDVLQKLAKIVGDENVLSSPADLYAYGFDASIHHAMPDVVLKVSNSKQVEKIVKLAYEEEIPIIPRGAGTALCGQCIPIHGGIILDMTAMNVIKEIRVEDLYCVVEPGVIYEKLNRELAKENFFFPPTPGSGDVCTIGGMVAVNASGMRAIKYGATRDYVLGMEVVLPNGKKVHFGTRTIKNSSGYQLERLMVGSEGTLGVITEVTIRILPLPEKRAVALASFPSLEKAGEGVANIIASSLLPSGLEIMDSVCIQAVNKAMNIGLPQAEAVLLVEVDGAESVVKRDVVKVAEICKKSGATSVKFAYESEEMLKLWKGRKGVLPSLSRYGEKMVSVSLADDMSVPISNIPKAIMSFQKVAKKYGIIIGTYGHAGDGNLHTKVLIDPLAEKSWEKAEKAVDEIYKAVLSLGGTVSGEHGIGISKAPWMQKERKEMLSVMEAIKKAIDPKNIMNPGKMMQWKGSIIAYVRYPVIP